jgi:hypothetical protein
MTPKIRAPRPNRLRPGPWVSSAASSAERHDEHSHAEDRDHEPEDPTHGEGEGDSAADQREPYDQCAAIPHALRLALIGASVKLDRRPQTRAPVGD